MTEPGRKPLEKGVPEVQTCGLVMPISGIDGCAPEHWMEVKSILKESVESIPEPRFTVRIVSDADDSGVIQKRIVQNIYNSDVIVCDVSGKNPNVMFELGLRLAFDKATVIVKDDKTEYSFDTGVIEHLTYPRDLRFSKIVDFKIQLAAKVTGTYSAAQRDPNHSPFLKNFGEFHVAELKQSAASLDTVILETLVDMQSELRAIKGRVGEFYPTSFEDKQLSESEFKALVERRLLRIIKEDGRSPSELIGDRGFLKHLEDSLPARCFFPHRSYFVRAANEVLRALASLDSFVENESR